VTADALVEAPVFTLPTCFPPTHGVPGPDGRTTYCGETCALIDGYRNLLLDVVVPERTDSGPVPVVVWIHGGGFRMGATEEVWSPWFVPMREKVLSAGLAFAAITYRFSSEALFPGVDGDRIALWGGSAGAQLALLVALTHDRPEFVEQVGVPGDDLPVAAVVDFFGPADALTMQDDDITGGRNDHERPDAPISRLVGGPPRENPDLARHAARSRTSGPTLRPCWHSTARRTTRSDRSRAGGSSLPSATPVRTPS
jgi:acetyl esterase/lipase